LLLLRLTCFSSAPAIRGWNKSEPPARFKGGDACRRSIQIRAGAPSRSLRLLSAAMDTEGSSHRALSGCILPYYNTFIPFPFSQTPFWSATKFHSFQKVLEY